MRKLASSLVGVCVVGAIAAIGFGTRWAALRSVGSKATDGSPSVVREPANDVELQQNRDRWLMDQVAALGAEVSLLKGRLAAQQSSIDAAASAMAANAAPPPRRTLEEAREEWHAHMADLEARFNSERIDVVWAAATRAEIERGLDQEPDLRAAAGRLECRAETCRLELRDDRSNAVDEAVPSFFTKLHGRLTSLKTDVVTNEKGESLHVLYMSANDSS